MLDQSSDLGCGAEDAGCLCKNVNFTYGIRDCSLQACQDDAEGIINYGAEYCRSEFSSLPPLRLSRSPAHKHYRQGWCRHHHCGPCRK